MQRTDNTNLGSTVINFSIEGSLSDIVLKRFEKYDLPSGDKVARDVAFSILPEMKQRIHVDGIASDGTPIGEYSNNYLKQRIKKNRGSDPKVIASFTRQQENDFSVTGISPGAYGIGYKNITNAEKAEHVEKLFKKKIFDLTTEEKALIPQIVETEIVRA